MNENPTYDMWTLGILSEYNVNQFVLASLLMNKEVT